MFIKKDTAQKVFRINEKQITTRGCFFLTKTKIKSTTHTLKLNACMLHKLNQKKWM